MQETFVLIPTALWNYHLIRIETSYGDGVASANVSLKLEKQLANGNIVQQGSTWTHPGGYRYDTQNFYYANSIDNLSGYNVRVVLHEADAIIAKGFSCVLVFADKLSACDPDVWEML